MRARVWSYDDSRGGELAQTKPGAHFQKGYDRVREDTIFGRHVEMRMGMNGGAY